MDKPNIVLVHGAFADASCWSKVIPILAAKGYNVVGVQNPLSSVPDDVATTRRMIDSMTGSTVVVGHSYAGGVIAQAAKGAANVKALVFLAAFPQNEGETGGELLGKFAATPLTSALRPDAAGFVYVDRAQFHAIFCPDLDAEMALVMGATQKPVHGSTFGAVSGPVALKDVPTYFQISEDDLAVSPELERFLADRMGATTLSLKSSHVAMLSHPQEIADFIEKAATD